MRKLLFILLLSIFICSCKKDDIVPNEESQVSEEPTVSEETQLLSLLTVENWFINNDVIAETGYVFINNEQNQIIADTVFNNGTNVSLSGVVDFNKHTYDISFQQIEKIEAFTDLGLITNYKINVFKDIAPLDLKLDNINRIDDDYEEGRIEFTNTNGMPDSLNILTKNTRGVFSAHADLIEFGVEFPLITKPDDLYFSFKKTNENFWKYVWLENVPEGFLYVLDYYDLPVLDNEVTLTTNSDFGFKRSNIMGAPKSHPREYTELFQITNEDPIQKVTYPIPTGIFESYKLSSLVVKDGTSYQTIEYTDFPNISYSIPDFSAVITNSSIDDFEINTTGDYDYYSITLKVDHLDYENTKNPNFENYTITWAICGKYSKTIKLKLSDILSSLSDRLPEFSEDEISIDIRLDKQESSLTYDKYISWRLYSMTDEEANFTKSESFSRYYEGF